VGTKSLPFDDVRRSLDNASNISKDESFAPNLRLDRSRLHRAGIPEVVFAEHKSADAVAAGLIGLAEANGRALASRCPQSTVERVREMLGDAFDFYHCDVARTLVVAQPGEVPQLTGGRIGVMTAGSSDAPIASEAAIIAQEMGVAVTLIRDVGVAGIHRLVEPLETLIAEGVDAIVVAAGMDGALPSVVAGLVAVPVIGLPTSVGYGYGGQGVGALMSMLQTCAPGLVVVNIDNGIGAGASAALIANRVAAARNER
jgi:pyridinium-3,5-biscarboxylic acid mononucleotide synthase